MHGVLFYEAYAIATMEAIIIATKLVYNSVLSIWNPWTAVLAQRCTVWVHPGKGSNKTYTTAYHPQGDGLVERTILAMLVTLTHEYDKDWESH